MIKEVDGKIIETHRWCYGCNEVKPLDHEHWGWVTKLTQDLELSVENAQTMIQ